jgi:hypothetical protein
MGIPFELILTPSNLEHFICSICRDFVENYKMIKLCEHIFCGECLDQTWTGKSNFCPECRVEFFSNDVGKSRILENLFADFIMKCSFEKCTENLTLAQYRSHIEKCNFRNISCHFCNKKIEFIDLEIHQVIHTFNILPNYLFRST